MPTKDYKKFTQGLKKVYGSASLKAANTAFEVFCKEWEKYPGAVEVWKRNYTYIEQLFDYGSAVRKIMYTTIDSLVYGRFPTFSLILWIEDIIA